VYLIRRPIVPIVTFPSYAPQFWNAARDAVQFLAIVDGTNFFCLLSREALEAHFGCMPVSEDARAQYLAAFLVHRAAIEAKARDKILDRQFESDGSIVLRTRDF
jgi:hypothetical protein